MGCIQHDPVGSDNAFFTSDGCYDAYVRGTRLGAVETEDGGVGWRRNH
jgi:hypothetical protein